MQHTVSAAISGLEDAVAPSGPMQITNLMPGAAPDENTFNGQWNPGTAALTLSLEPLILLAAGETAPAKQRNFKFSFVVKNPNYPRLQPPTITMRAEILPIEHCNYDETATQVFEEAMTSPTVCATEWNEEWGFAGTAASQTQAVSVTTEDTLAANQMSGTKTVVTTTKRLTSCANDDGCNSNFAKCWGCCDQYVCTNTTKGNRFLFYFVRTCKLLSKPISLPRKVTYQERCCETCPEN